MESEPAKDLEAQKATDPEPNATVPDDPDESRQSTSHAAPVSPASVVKSDHGDSDRDYLWFAGYKKARATLNEKKEDGVRSFIFYKMMNEMNILHLEIELKETQKDVFKAEASGLGKEVRMTRLEDQLHRYSKTHSRDSLNGELTFAFNTATAIRDYEYMNNLNNSTQAFNDPLIDLIPAAWQKKTLPRRANNSSDPLRERLGRILPHRLRWTREEATMWSRAYHDRKITPEITSPSVDKLARFIVAMTGGLSVVIPMLIMSIPQGSTRSLVTTSVAVVFFAGIISVGFSTSNGETLGITAAYAAVLVVFVGTSVQQASTDI